MELQSFECPTCEMCLVGLNDYQIHVNSLEHAIKIQLKNSKNTTEKSKECNSTNVRYASTSEQVASSCNDMIVKSVNMPASMDSRSLQCELCQKQCTGIEPYQQHLVSLGHKKKLSMSLNQSNSIELLKCVLCDKNFSGLVPYEQHMSSKVHQKKVLDMEFRQKGNLFASLLAQSETSDKSDVQPEGRDVDHLENSSQVKIPGYSSQNDVRRWRCNVCDMVFTFSLYEEHMCSDVHTKKLREREILRNNPNATCTAESLLHNKENHASSSHLMQMLKCIVCDKSFSGPVPYNQHMQSQQHMKKVRDKDMLRKLLSTNEIDSTSDNVKKSALHNYASYDGNASEFHDKACSPYQLSSVNQIAMLQFKCEVCEKYFNGRIPFDQHMSSSPHQKKLLQKTSQLNSENKSIDGVSVNCTPKSEIPDSQNWFCKICNKQCTGSVPFSQHIMSDAHFKKKLLLETQENMKEICYLDSVKPALIPEDTNEMSIEDNCGNSDENEMDSTSPDTQQINSDLIFGDVLKDLNFETPETLNVTIFETNKNVVFDIALK